MCFKKYKKQKISRQSIRAIVKLMKVYIAKCLITALYPRQCTSLVILACTFYPFVQLHDELMHERLNKKKYILRER